MINVFTQMGLRAVSRQLCRRYSAMAEVGEKTLESDRPKVIKLAHNDKILSQTMLQVKSKKTRAKSGFILIEGTRLLKDIMATGEKPVMVFFSQTEDLQQFKFDSETILYKTPYNDLKMWTDVVTSQGIMGIFKRPPPMAERNVKYPITVVCDQIRDPGNLGAILRVSAGVGVRNVQLVKGCTDPWDSKVLRSAAGAHFKIPIYTDADLFEIFRDLKSSCLISLATNEPKSFNKPIKDIAFKPYFDVNFDKFDENYVVIGGEAFGISNEVYEIAKKMNGIKISIPLENEVESLNAATAASVILFEIKKQYLLSHR